MMTTIERELVGAQVRVIYRNRAHVGTVSKLYANGGFKVDFDGTSKRFNANGSEHGASWTSANVAKVGFVDDVAAAVAEYNTRADAREAEQQAMRDARQIERNRRWSVAAEIVRNAKRTDVETSAGVLHIFDAITPNGFSVFILKRNSYTEYTKAWSWSVASTGSDSNSLGSTHCEGATAEDAVTDLVATWCVPAQDGQP